MTRIALPLMAMLFLLSSVPSVIASANGRGLSNVDRNDSIPHERDATLPMGFGIEQEAAPVVSSVAEIPDDAPGSEMKSRSGSPKSYEINGITYRLMGTSDGYREQGVASWYGDYFHGRQTASGDTYDMYEMTAAHKTLPLPTYVRVTHLENGRSVVLRVNDRGPFVEGRIIDLSYVAAQELGIAESGIARVEVEALAMSSRH